MALDVDLVATDRTIWQGEATMVVAPAVDGEIGILTGHSPVLAVLRPGNVRIRATDGEVLEAHVSGGFLSVDSDKVTIVADDVEAAAGTALAGR